MMVFRNTVIGNRVEQNKYIMFLCFDDHFIFTKILFISINQPTSKNKPQNPGFKTIKT